MENKWLSSEEFQNKINEGSLNIILMGQSWVWKTEWQRSITKGGFWFKEIELDERIWNNPIMKKFLEWVQWEDEAEKMWNAFWKPWEDPVFYKNIEKEYLVVEKQELIKLAEDLKWSWWPYIADFTGSSPYCKEEFAKVLPLWLVVYLGTWKQQYKQMQENFLADPKPICWWDIINEWEDFVKQWNAFEQLPTLYAKLLDHRNKLYEAAADVIIPWEEHREKADINNPQSLFDLIKEKLG